MRRLTRDEFIQRANVVHNDTYIYTKTNYINRRTKVCIICPKHGEFWQTAGNHLAGNGCPYCFNKTTDDFISEAKKVHGNDNDYSKVVYINNYTKVCIICPKHGEFWQTPSDHLRGRNCPKCGKTHSTNTFIEDAKIVHNNRYDLSKVVYRKSNIKVCIICPDHGEFWQTPNSHLSGQGVPKV